jgi:hypothetical protein
MNLTFLPEEKAPLRGLQEGLDKAQIEAARTKSLWRDWSISRRDSRVIVRLSPLLHFCPDGAWAFASFGFDLLAS